MSRLACHQDIPKNIQWNIFKFSGILSYKILMNWLDLRTWKNLDCNFIATKYILLIDESTLLQQLYHFRYIDLFQQLYHFSWINFFATKCPMQYIVCMIYVPSETFQVFIFRISFFQFLAFNFFSWADLDFSGQILTFKKSCCEDSSPYLFMLNVPANWMKRKWLSEFVVMT